MFMILVLGFVWFLFQNQQKTDVSLAPVTLKEEEETTTPEISQNEFYLEETFPPSGKIQTISKYTHILFKFSKPIVGEEVQIRVKPYISLKKDYSEDMKILYISPRSEPWLDQVWYTITITNVRSTTGDKLDNETIKHEYYNEPPIIEGIGESG